MITPVHPTTMVRYSEFLDATKGEPRETVLELGPWNGHLTACLCETYQHVLSIEGRSDNVRDTKNLLISNKFTNYTVVEQDVTKLDYSKLGKFSLVFNSGILYHLPEPWSLLTALSKLTDAMWVCTHIADNITVTVNGYDGLWYKENPADRLSGMSSNSSFWPTEKSLIQMLKDTGGWTNITKIGDTSGNQGRLDMFWGNHRVQYFCKK